MATPNNTPTICRAEASVTARAVEYSNQSDLDFNGGMNLAASNSPGIGINTGDVTTVAAERWTLADQHTNERKPQNAGHIGVTGLAAGNNTVNNSVADYLAEAVPVTCVMAQQDEDVPNWNDPAHLVTVVAASVANGADIDASGVYNRTGQTIFAGDVVWGVEITA